MTQEDPGRQTSEGTGTPPSWRHEKAELLLRSIEDRLKASDRTINYDTFGFCERMIDAGEYGLYLDAIVAAISEGEIPVTAAERDALQQLLDSMRNAWSGYKFLARRDEIMSSLTILEEND